MSRKYTFSPHLTLGLLRNLLATLLILNSSLAWCWSGNPSMNTLVASGDQNNVLMGAFKNGNGGVVIFYARAASDPKASASIHLQELGQRGEKLLGAQGMQLIPESHVSSWPVDLKEARVIPSSDSGYFLVWVDDSDPQGTYVVRAQKISNSGASAWTQDVAIYQMPSRGTVANARLVDDGFGGFFIAWLVEYSTGTHFDVKAQHVDANGNLVWGSNGKVIAQQAQAWTMDIFADQQGGAIIAWADKRSSGAQAALTSVYGQRFKSDGSLLWAPSDIAKEGLRLTPNVDINNAAMASDGQGGIVISWSCVRNHKPSSKIPPISDIDVYAQRWDGNGAVMWGDQGIVVADNESFESPRKIVASSGGEVVLGWNDGYERAMIYDLQGKARRPSRLMLRSGSSYQILSGENGDWIFVWEYLESVTDIYAQKIDSTGQEPWKKSSTFLSMDNGVAVSTAEQQQAGAITVSDGGGGIISVFSDTRDKFNGNAAFYTALYAQRVYASGTLSSLQRPVNVFPQTNYVVNPTPTLASSAFEDESSETTHAASQWQVVMLPKDGSPVETIYDSEETTSDLTSHTLPQEIQLQETLTYSWRVRYRNNLGDWSQWSQGTLFTIDATLPAGAKSNGGGGGGDSTLLSLMLFFLLVVSRRNQATIKQTARGSGA